MIFIESFQKRFLDFCQKNHLLTAKSVLVAFSGGADSVVLLSLLRQYANDFGYSLTALHVNHGIRKDEASRDALFCETFCKHYGIPFVLRKIDVPAIAEERGTGLEETARCERYRILREYAKENGIDSIATAHNATDNLETLLFHLARGMSIHGAGGIHPLRDGLIRPLLPFSKDEILAYAKSFELPFVYDSTNDDTNYTRNYIRHNLLPGLRHINPDVEMAALRFAESARQADSTLDSLARPYAHCDETSILAGLDDAILSRVLLIKYRNIANNEITQTHLCALMDLIREGKNKHLSLPGKITAHITPNSFQLIEQSMEPPSFLWDEQTLSLDTGCFFADRYHIHLVDFRDTATFTLYKGGIEGELYVRTRRSGDTYVVGGMTRKIKKMLCDYKIPQEDRDQIPFLCDEKGVIAVLGLPLADRVNPLKNPNPDLIYIQIQDTQSKGCFYGKPEKV